MVKDKLEVLNYSSNVVTENTYHLRDENGRIYFYKEWLDESGKVIDCVVRNEGGHDISDVPLVEQIWEFIDTYQHN